MKDKLIKQKVKELCKLAKEVYGEQKVIGYDRWREIVSFQEHRKVYDGLPSKMSIEEHNKYLETLDYDAQDDYTERYNKDKNWDDMLHNLICKENGDEPSF
jgi:hypothetical protein